MKTIKILFLNLLIISAFISCNNESNKPRATINLVNLNTLNFENAWIDFPLSIVHSKKLKDYIEYDAKAIYNNDTIGIKILLKKNIPAGIVNGELKNVFLNEGIAFISTGKESDKFLSFLAEKYKISSKNIQMKDSFMFACANLNQTRLNYSTGVNHFKIFLEKDQQYAELFVNFDFSKRQIFFKEKDEAYRKDLIELLKK